MNERKIRYKGPKRRIGITLPVGAGHTSIIQTVFADPFVVLREEDALKLIALDPRNFELVDETANREEKKPSSISPATPPSEVQEKKEASPTATLKKRKARIVFADLSDEKRSHVR